MTHRYIRTNVYLTSHQLDGLKTWSSKTGLSTAEHVRRAVDGYLQALERRARDRQETTKARLLPPHTRETVTLDDNT